MTFLPLWFKMLNVPTVPPVLIVPLMWVNIAGAKDAELRISTVHAPLQEGASLLILASAGVSE